VSTDQPQTPPVEETLAWEAERRPRIALIAIVGGIMTVVGNILLAAITSSGPTQEDGFIGLTESIDAHLNGTSPEGPSLAVRQIDDIGDNVAMLSVTTVLTSLSAAALMYLMLFLYRAAYNRGPEVGRTPYYAALAGLLFYPLGHLIREISQWIAAADFANSADRTADGARKALSEPITTSIGAIIELVGTFGLSVGIVLVCLGAMRAGLLTRFFGVLGIIVGGLAILGSFSGQQLDQPGVIRAFFMIGTGLLLAGRLRTPPAWETGRAEPWPSRQQMLEQRQAESGERPQRGRQQPAAPAAPPSESAEPKVPARTRKKRKDRR
jgi:hypothetical protein